MATTLAACGGSWRSTDEPSTRVAATAPHRTPPTPTTPEDWPVAGHHTLAPLKDGRPRRALLSIPAIGLHDLVVVAYRGWTDDAPGTRIQDRGRGASPFGPRGGVGPGGIGNYQITGHRTSSTHPFADLPSLRVGARAVVRVANVSYVYEIRRTRQTSFRSARSLSEQRAAVPGHPGQPASRAFLTLSTCATLEDHAAGNDWSDAQHNPEHRIDKIGVLARTVVTDGPLGPKIRLITTETQLASR